LIMLGTYKNMDTDFLMLKNNDFKYLYLKQ